MRIAVYFIGMVWLSLAAVGCVNKEPEERAAFITGLQTQVIASPDLRVPAPDEAQRDAWGDYAKQYAVLMESNNAAAALKQHLVHAFDHATLSSVAQLQARLEVLRTDRQALLKAREALREVQTQAQAQRAEWKQPADLQTVYAQAYNKAVTQPAEVLDGLATTVLAALDDALRAADFVARHASQMTIEADSASVQDPSVQHELNQLLDALNSHAAAIEQALSRLQTLQSL